VRGCWLAGLLLVAAAVVAPPARATDPRSQVLVDYHCSNDLGRRQVTLFGNGTVRLREGLEGEEVMRLAELAPSELHAYLRRLRAEDLREVAEDDPEVVGEWVERCYLELDLPGREPRRFGFGKFDTLPLPLSRVVRVVEDLAATAAERAPTRGLPADYRPQPGDRLRRVDGAIFEVVEYTSDGLGIELRGEDQPLTLFLTVDEVRERFVELVDEGRR
jgi:hypothetical protein